MLRVRACRPVTMPTHRTPSSPCWSPLSSIGAPRSRLEACSASGWGTPRSTRAPFGPIDGLVMCSHLDARCAGPWMIFTTNLVFSESLVRGCSWRAAGIAAIRRDSVAALWMVSAIAGRLREAEVRVPPGLSERAALDRQGGAYLRTSRRIRTNGHREHPCSSRTSRVRVNDHATFTPWRSGDRDSNSPQDRPCRSEAVGAAF